MSAVIRPAHLPRVCFVGLDNLAALASEYGHLYVGGEAIQQSLLAKAFARRGYTVSTIVTDHGQPDGATWHGVQVFKAFDKSAGLPVARFVYPRWTGLWAAMRRANADVYYTSCAGAQVGQMAMFCRKYGRALVYRSASDTDCDPKRLLIRYWRDRKLYEYGLRRADAVLTQSRKQEELMQANYGLKSSIAGMLVEAGTLRPLIERDVSMLWVSNVRQLKRPELFMQLCEQLPTLRGHMVGGPMRGDEELFNRTRESAQSISNLHFHGAVPYHRTSEIFDRARVFVNTSDIEGFPNTFLQAWIRGTPVVSFFDPDGVIEREGLGHRATSLEDMREAIAELSRNDVAWAACSKRCRAFMDTHFSEDKILQPYVDAITQGARASA